jgi:hypothetical protein
MNVHKIKFRTADIVNCKLKYDQEGKKKYRRYFALGQVMLIPSKDLISKLGN